MNTQQRFAFSCASLIASALALAFGHKTKSLISSPPSLVSPTPIVAGSDNNRNIPVAESANEGSFDGEEVQPPRQEPGPFTKPERIVAKTSSSAWGKEPIYDPIARIALSYVGADLDAESYWIDAINNSSLPGNERKDLIEDLNEEDFSNSDTPSGEDLPLIMCRLELIEQLAPSAIDKVNSDAFMEAHNDLLKMLHRLQEE